MLCECKIDVLPKAFREVGIDLGLKDLAITSDGHKFVHPKELLTKATRRLKRNQRKLARKKKRQQEQGKG
jgi:putative transposase